MKSDYEMMQGIWQEVYRERDGVADPSDGEEGWRPTTVIYNNTFTVSISDGSVVLVGTFELFDRERPKAIVWHDVSGSYASDHPIPAIYELTDSSFAFCAAYDGLPRPTEFRTGRGHVLRRMTRIG